MHAYSEGNSFSNLALFFLWGSPFGMNQWKFIHCFHRSWLEGLRRRRRRRARRSWMAWLFVAVPMMAIHISHMVATVLEKLLGKGCKLYSLFFLLFAFSYLFFTSLSSLFFFKENLVNHDCFLLPLTSDNCTSIPKTGIFLRIRSKYCNVFCFTGLGSQAVLYLHCCCKMW